MGNTVLSHHCSGWKTVWEFPQSHSEWDNKPRWVHWLQTASALELRTGDQRSSRRRRGRWGKEEKEGQLAKQIWTLLYHRREAFWARTLPNSPHHLHRQHHLLLHRLAFLLFVLNALRSPMLSFQQWIRGWGRRRIRRWREGAGGHGRERWDSKVAVTPQEWESAKQQQLYNHWVR